MTRRLALAALTALLAFGVFTVFVPCPSSVVRAASTECCFYDNEIGMCLVECDPRPRCDCFTGTSSPCGGDCEATWPGCGPFWIYPCNGLGNDKGAIFLKQPSTLRMTPE